MTTVMSPMVLVDPTVQTVAASTAMAPRPASLDGLTVGLLNNAKPKADLVLEATWRLLAERYNLASAVHHTKGSSGRPFPADVMDDVVRRCQVVVTAMGD